MTKKCDHSKITTLFCPFCGEAIENGGAQIIQFLRGYIVKSKKTKAQIEQWLRKHPNQHSTYQTEDRAEKHAAKIEKIEGWIRWIEERME